MRLSYSSAAALGFRNRYCTIHHYFFFAGVLDPRVKNCLPAMMHPSQYAKLISDFETALIADALKRTNSNSSDTAKWMKSMFDGIKTLAPAKPSPTDVQNQRRVITDECREEMRRFMKVAIDLTLYDDCGNITDPLLWWKANCSEFEHLSMMARQYLAIPATSAPSERVWSRASNLLNSKRSKLKEEALQRMMFFKENANLLWKHFWTLRLDDTGAEKFAHLVEEEMNFLPDFFVDIDGMDIGQNDVWCWLWLVNLISSNGCILCIIYYGSSMMYDVVS